MSGAGTASLMAQFHFFDINDAKKYGIHEAIILQNIKHWVLFNKQNRNLKNFHEGRFWTFNSVKNFAKNVFTYFSDRQVQHAISNLKDMGALLEGCFNEKKYDSTKWYTLNDDTSKDDQSGDDNNATPSTNLLTTQHQNNTPLLTKLSNGINKFVKPIPDINPDIKKEGEEVSSAKPKSLCEAKELLEFWNSKNIIEHKITETLIAAIGLLMVKKRMPLQSIKQAIERFADVLHRKDCYWTKKWTLREFLSDRAIRFYLEDFSIESYLSSSSPKGGQNNGAKLTQSACLTNEAEDIFKAARLRGLLEDQKNGVTYEHLP